MKIVTILNAHDNGSLVSDTISSIKCNVGDDILMVVDGLFWKSWGKNFDTKICKMEGFVHGCNKAPYRNLALGLKKAYETWNADWYLYTEYDCLFGNKAYLEFLKTTDSWLVGSNYNISDKKDLRIIEKMLKVKFDKYSFLLGSCLFFRREFIEKLIKLDFFNKFLFWTNGMLDGDFPYYEGYNLSEHMYPTLVEYFGEKVANFSGENFLMRRSPEVNPQEFFRSASIIHPNKSFGEIRQFFKEKRWQEYSQ